MQTTASAKIVPIVAPAALNLPIRKMLNMKFIIAPKTIDTIYSLSLLLGINNCILTMEAIVEKGKDILSNFNNNADSLKPSPKYKLTKSSAVAQNPNITGKTIKNINKIDFSKILLNSS